MQRRLSLLLAGLAIFAIVLHFGVFQPASRQNGSAQDFRFVEYAPLTPLSNQPLTKIQTLVDRVSEAAVNEQWNGAEMWMQELEKTWQQMKTGKTEKLRIEGEISNSIINLQRNVAARNTSQVLAAAWELTTLLGRLADTS